jgi:hypothetical protein
MHGRAVGAQRRLGVEHEGERLVRNRNLLRRVLSARACVRNNRGDPFTVVTHLPDRERKASHPRGVEPVHQRIDGSREFLASKHCVHARHGERGRRIDRDDARRGMRRRHQRDMQHAGKLDVGDEAAVTGDKAPVLAHPARRLDKLEVRRRAHAPPPGDGGRFEPARRLAASAIASTIWP